MKHRKEHEPIVLLFKEKDIHITRPRIQITAILACAGEWLSLADIIHRAAKFDRATVYRVLLLLYNHGMIQKMVDAEKISYYKFAHDEEHENTYFKCLRCGGITVLPAHGAVSLPEGFNKTSSNLVITGYCNTCAALHS